MKRGRAFSSVVDTSLAMWNTLGSIPSDTLAATINVKACTILIENELKMEVGEAHRMGVVQPHICVLGSPQPQMQQWAVLALMRLEMTISED